MPTTTAIHISPGPLGKQRRRSWHSKFRMREVRKLFITTPITSCTRDGDGRLMHAPLKVPSHSEPVRCRRAARSQWMTYAAVTRVLAHRTFHEVPCARSACPNDPSRSAHFIHLGIIVTYMASIEHVYTVTQSKFGI